MVETHFSVGQIVNLRADCQIGPSLFGIGPMQPPMPLRYTLGILRYFLHE